MKVFLSFIEWVRRVNLFLLVVGGVSVVVIMILTTIDVTGRYAFRKPLAGAFEICELALVTTVVCTWAYTQSKRGHVSIDLIFSRFPRRTQVIISIFTELLVLFFAIMIALQAVPDAMATQASGDWSDYLHIPIYPFKFLIFAGSLALSGQLIVDIVDIFKKTWGSHCGNIT